MSRKKAASSDTFLDRLSAEVLKVLEMKEICCKGCGELMQTEASAAEKLKAIEAGTKLAMIRHKIDGGEAEGSFYGN